MITTQLLSSGETVTIGPISQSFAVGDPFYHAQSAYNDTVLGIVVGVKEGPEGNTYTVQTQGVFRFRADSTADDQETLGAKIKFDSKSGYATVLSTSTAGSLYRMGVCVGKGRGEGNWPYIDVLLTH
jgi:hypothetical protein